jgi:radical SAM superfamily enzyme YgiQ (UPF0313 family)
LNAAHKSFNKVKNYEENIKKMHRAGINVVGAFIFGFENDTPASFDKVYNFAMKNRLAMVNTGVMTPFPGTEVYERAKKEGKIFDYDWEHYTGANLVWHHPTMSKDEIEELYTKFRQRFYSWPSIFKRFWGNRAHPLYYFGMNFTHWWRAYRNSRRPLPSVAPFLPRVPLFGTPDIQPKAIGEIEPGSQQEKG